MNKDLVIWNKKQVGAVLKVLKYHLNTRPSLSNVNITSEGYLEFSDGYQAHRTLEPIIEYQGEEKMHIKIEDLQKWYKLASGKDTFKVRHALEVMSEDDTQYPDLSRLLKGVEPVAITHIKLNTKNLKMFLDIVGEDVLFEFTGEMRFVRTVNDMFLSILLPMRFDENDVAKIRKADL